MTPADVAIVLAAAAEPNDAQPADTLRLRYARLHGQLDRQADELRQLAPSADVVALLAEIERVRAVVVARLAGQTATIH